MPRRASLTLAMTLNVAALTSAAVAAVSFFNAGVFRDFHLSATADELAREAGILEPRVLEALDAPRDLDALCREVLRNAGVRVTVIAADGAVIADSQGDPSAMDNHLRRPEVAAALSGRPATAVRSSNTLGESLVYAAVPLLRGGRPIAVLRMSRTVAAARAALRLLWARSALGGLVVAILAAALLWRATVRLTRPVLALTDAARALSAGELGRRVSVRAPAEVADLAQAFNSMAADLQGRIATILRQNALVETIFASMPDAVLVIDSQGAIIDLNDAAASLLDTPRAEAFGRSVSSVVRSREILEFIRRAGTEAGPVEEGLTLYREREQHLLARATLFGDAGKAAGRLVIIRDVSHLRRLETLRRDFAANVSHELKTPVTSIKGFIETLQDGAISDPASARRFLEIIGREADRLSAIIEDLTSLARLDQHEQRGDVELTVIRIRPVLEAAIEACGASAAARRVQVILECPSDLAWRANAALLERAVANLVDNAVKYSPESAPVIVRAEREDEDLSIRVQDSGCGIAGEHLDRIFERFYVVDRARSRAQGGTGLGLAIVKHVAQTLGGRVTVASEVGKGSTFTIRLPGPVSPGRGPSETGSR